MAQTINKEEAKRNRKERLEAYVAAAHLRFAPAGPPWRPCVRGMRQNCRLDGLLEFRDGLLGHSLLLVGPSENCMLPWIVRLRFQELRRQADCLIVIPGGEAMPAEAGVQSVSDRIQLHGAPALGLRFGKPAHGHKVVRMFMADIGVAWVKLQRALEFLLRSRKIPVVVQLGQRQRTMALRQALVFLYCQTRRFLHLAPALAGGYCAEEGQKRVSFGHMGVGRGVVRIELDGLTVVVDAFLQIEIIEVVVCPKVVLVRLDVHCLHVWRWGWLRTTQAAFDLLGDRRRYLILQGEHVGEVAFKSIGPEMPIVRGAN